MVMEGERNDKGGRKGEQRMGRYGSILIHYRETLLISVILLSSTHDGTTDLLVEEVIH